MIFINRKRKTLKNVSWTQIKRNVGDYRDVGSNYLDKSVLRCPDQMIEMTIWWNRDSIRSRRSHRSHRSDLINPSDESSISSRKNNFYSIVLHLAAFFKMSTFFFFFFSIRAFFFYQISVDETSVAYLKGSPTL